MESIDCNGILITIKEIAYNCRENCPSYCTESRVGNICLYKKQLSLKPVNTEVVYNKLILNIKNKTDEPWNGTIYNWRMIDSEGLLYNIGAICPSFKTPRTQTFPHYQLSPKTQIDYRLIFPETEYRLAKIVFSNIKAKYELNIKNIEI